MSSRDLVLIALFAAIVAALGLVPPIMLPVIGVPITAQSMGPMLAGAILGARRGGLSMLLFLLLVAAGLPLLSGGRGGWAIFVGPTAGYLVAFPIAAWAIGRVTDTFGERLGFAGLFCTNVIFGLVLVHAIGVPVVSLVLGISLMEALVADFAIIPGDLIKSVVAALVAVQLRRAYPAVFVRS